MGDMKRELRESNSNVKSLIVWIKRKMIRFELKFCKSL